MEPSADPRLVVALEAPARGWRRRASGGERRLVVSPEGIELEHPLCRAPLRLTFGAVATACVDPGPARAGACAGRFPVLRRLGERVIPREEGIEGWLWTSTGGSALLVLGEDDEAPNAALVLAQPLDQRVVGEAFAPELVRAIAARSPFGAPSLYGLLLRVADPVAAESAFRRTGLLRPLTDREVPKLLRRSLPTDRPADPSVRLAAQAPARGSVGPPGF